MNHAIGLFLKESIEMELNVADVYQLYSIRFPQDHDFWWKISLEEMNHAALIESINDNFLSESILPADTIEKEAENLHKMNLRVKLKIEQFKLDSPTRVEAFKYAMEMENSIGESHFEVFMTTIPDSPVMKIFQKLNGDDLNHAKRIAKYAKDNGIV